MTPRHWYPQGDYAIVTAEGRLVSQFPATVVGNADRDAVLESLRGLESFRRQLFGMACLFHHDRHRGGLTDCRDELCREVLEEINKFAPVKAVSK